MDHVVYLDHKAKELESLSKGNKSMIIRGAMGRKLPYGRVKIGDCLYFIENNGDGLIKAKAVVSEVIESAKLTPEESHTMIHNNQLGLMPDNAMIKRFAGKRYIVIISIRDFLLIENFKIDRSGYGNMDDWLMVGDIEKVRI